MLTATDPFALNTFLFVTASTRNCWEFRVVKVSSSWTLMEIFEKFFDETVEQFCAFILIVKYW